MTEVYRGSTDHRAFYTHVWRVERLAAHGVSAPAEWLRLRQRWADYDSLSSPCATNLARELTTPTGQDVSVLRALALAEESATSINQADLDGYVRSVVLDRMLQLNRPVAEANYRTVAKLYDDSASAFHSAAKTVDVEADADTVLKLGTRAQQAWFAAADVAKQLDELSPLLLIAAELGGAPVDHDQHRVVAEVELALLCDPGSLHRRRVWEAWTASGRCGHWSALHKLGVKIRAHSNPQAVQGYSKPRDLVPVGYRRGITQYADPEDGAAQRNSLEGWVKN